MAAHKAPWMVGGAGVLFYVISVGADLVENIKKVGAGLNAVGDLPIRLLIQPLAPVLVFIGMWWWLHREMVDLRAGVEQEREHLRREAQRQADNFSERYRLLEEQKQALAKAKAAPPG